jgi:fucose 4-O-acetylase-like acetyltransferase
MLTKKREVWIDYAKFISIFLVVLFHTNPNLDGYIFDFLKLLRMPAFFLIAGLLFDINKWNSFIDFFKHRFKRLIIPYCWFSLIFYLFWLFFGRNLVGGDELNINIFIPIKEFFWGTPNVVLAPYWFITCLFCMQILFYLLKRLSISNYTIIILSILAYLGIIYCDIENLPWCIDKTMRFMPFYAFANILKNHDNSRFIKQTHFIIILTIFSIAILIINHKYIVSLYIDHLLYIIAGFCIMPTYITFCKLLAKTCRELSFIKYVGDNNIITLALQNYIIGFSKIIGIMFFSVNILTTNYYSVNVLLSLFTISIAMICAVFINKYAPFIVGKQNK